ncbi:hypothetical protein [Pedobacter antarcticus]|uniref:hypothetical protein n=1 Tax=Pedobacter antarcticus TaxID=34086 RepID=UPI001C58890B|nr:hypothetical protein [Pedobacter antarcticus]
MERRELFTRIFGSQPAKAPVTREPDPVLATPDYLNKDEAVVYDKTWYDVPENETFAAVIASSFGLEYRMEVVPERIQASALFTMYFKRSGDNAAEPVSFGMNENYSLFINEEIDSRQTDADSLFGAVQLVLTVNPQAEGRAYVSIKLIDHYGLTLATLKSSKFMLSDWDGEFSSGPGLSLKHDVAPGWKIRMLQIKGYQNKQNNLI